MDAKLCRQCKQPIHPEARVCHYCKNYQGWFGSANDPRQGLFVIAILIIIAIGAYLLEKKNTPNLQANINCTIKTSSIRFIDTANGPRIFIIGKVANNGDRDVSNIWYRVNIYGIEGKLIDSIALSDTAGLIVPAHSESNFRITSITAAKELELGKFDIKIIRQFTLNNQS